MSNMGSNKKMSKRNFVALAVFFAFILLIGLCALYLSDYYRADTESIEAFIPDGVSYSEGENGELILNPTGATRGFIFYPGGKVEHTSYIPLMRALAEKGILCIIVKMPFNLAVFDVNAADGICAQYPQIESWYIGGHSLGGSMAASYLLKNADLYEGIVFLGSYSTADISQCGVDVLSVYGSEDMVMNREKYTECKQNLPEAFYELVIEGGCHAYFGMYGEQDGDGVPTISDVEQINFTAEAIDEFMCGN